MIKATQGTGYVFPSPFNEDHFISWINVKTREVEADYVSVPF